MILTVEELRKFVTTDETDEVLTLWLEATEQMIRGYTNNNFHKYMGKDGVTDYPADVKMGVVNLAKWELKNRAKTGVQSESISRHTVTYYNMDKDNTELSYPASMMGFLKPYMKARFGQGLSL